jgi:3-deoxy-manno-octulosonate cytidylyltransferase (CMP-KDO synthetase)
MSLACVIPARYNSSRFPGKLLAKVQGKTVLERTFECASRCSVLNSLYVATDDEKIAEHVRQIGGEVLWTSTVPRDGTARVIEAMSRHDALQNASYVMVLQGDHPCTKPETIERIAQDLISSKDAVLATAAAPIRNMQEFLSPDVVKCVFDVNGYALYFSRAPIPCHFSRGSLSAFAHIGIYCYRRPFLEHLASLKTTALQENEDLEQLKVLELGYRIKVTMADEKTPSVDTPSDLVKLEEYLCRQNTFS